MGYALLFAGQGSQHAGMLPWLHEARECEALLDALGQALGSDWRANLTDREWATRNRVAQPLIVGTSLAAWGALSVRLNARPTAVAGYSVGELSAFAAAGAFTPQQALELAGRRAMLMDEAVRGSATGLLSVSGMEEGDVLARCSNLEPAIRLDRQHGIYAGSEASLAAAQAELGVLATVTRVDVALASHSSWMRSAASGFAKVLQSASLQRTGCPVVMNANAGATREPRVLRDALARQIDHPVLWQGCMTTLAERGPRCVLELGPGRALARMWAAQHPDIPVRSIDDFRHVDGAAAWVGRNS